MLSRRGYGSSAFNKSECVVNASLTQSLWRDKWELTLEGRDLFHQLSNTTYEVNAQGRTETWYRVIPNYLMLHLVYKFTPKLRKPNRFVRLTDFQTRLHCFQIRLLIEIKQKSLHINKLLE